jgi:MFS transporter, FSR family, fosmidomycin resistance protein
MIAASSPELPASSAKLSLGFSCVGHAYSHLFTMLYLTIVLVLEREWGLGYAELLRLSTLGALLFGAAALPMGWIGDRWSAVGMMVVYFVATGAAAILTGLARNPTEMMLGLAAIGLAASIYHPVGIAWLVRNAAARGKALGVNGLFGAIGVAGASGVAGVLTDLISWRAAFILPGIVSIATGLVLIACWRLGLVADRRSDRVPEAPASRQDMWRTFFVLSLTMMCAGLIYQCATTVMPKLLAERLSGWVEGTSAVGLVVMVMYLCTGMMQIYGGHLADRFPVKTVYILTSALQVPVLAFAAMVAGPAIVPVLMAALALHVMSIPAEGSLLARYTPSQHRSLAFGAKFVIALGIAPVGIMLAAWIEETTGSFTLLFVTLAAFALTLASAALFLPGERPAAPVLAPAE